MAQLLFYEDLTDVVLVGTSSGGMVVCRVAELMRERIGRIALVDALALFNGEKIGDIVTRSTATVVTALSRGPSREDAATRLFADLDPATRAWAVERLHPASDRHLRARRQARFVLVAAMAGRASWCGAAGRKTRARRTSAAPPSASAPNGPSSTPATTRC